MLSEVVPQVAALPEDGVAAADLTAEVELVALGILVCDSDRHMPVRGNPFELLALGHVSLNPVLLRLLRLRRDWVSECLRLFRENRGCLDIELEGQWLVADWSSSVQLFELG